MKRTQEERQVKNSSKLVSLKMSQKLPMTVTVIPVLVDEEMRLKDIISLTQCDQINKKKCKTKVR